MRAAIRRKKTALAAAVTERTLEVDFQNEGAFADRLPDNACMHKWMAAACERNTEVVVRFVDAKEGRELNNTAFHSVPQMPCLLLQGGGLCQNLIGELCQAVVLILPVIQRFDLIGGFADGVQMPSELLKAANQAGFVLNLLHGGLRPDNDVPDALPGDALIFGNLRQGEVLIII